MAKSESKVKKSPTPGRRKSAAKPAAKAADRKALAAALRSGRARAMEVFADREGKRRQRAAVVKKHARAARRKGAPDAALAEEPEPGSAGVLVAEGDSWFDYPFYDVLKILDDDYGYAIEAVAHRGDPIETMAYGGGQLDDFARCLERVLRNGTAPKAILVSGGGNDVAGDVFAMLINHRLSPRPGFNAGILDGVLEQRIRLAFVTILSAVTQLCVQYLGRPVPVLVHGYDFPVPDGRGFLGGFGALPGPWLEPGFREKGYADLGERIDLAEKLIDRFNAMIQEVSVLPEFAHVHYVDLRNTLSNALGTYRRWWGNELHPTRRGFDAVTARFATAIANLP